MTAFAGDLGSIVHVSPGLLSSYITSPNCCLARSSSLPARSDPLVFVDTLLACSLHPSALLIWKHRPPPQLHQGLL